MGEAVESVRIVMEHYQRINVEKIIYEEMKSRFLMKHVEDMIAMTDSDGHFLFVNQRCTDLLKELPIPPQSKKALYEHPSIRTTKETSREEQSGQFQVAFYSAEIKLTRPHGEPEYFALQDIGLRTGDHDFGSMLLLHDLTEDRKLDKIKMDMINVIVHELRNPLSSVIGFISLILEFSDFTIEEIREHLKMAYEASTELNQLIDRFLNVQRLESGRVQFRKEHVDTVGMVQQLINAQKPKLLQKSIEIMYIPQPDMPTVYGAPELLHDAFLNLISNAIKYGDENRTIDIVLRAEPDMMYFVITDHGYGIAPEEQANLFKKFYRVQSNIKAYQQVGTGLGLAHVKEVASYHSGTIALESTPEIGCRFTLSIPLVEPPNSEEEKNAHF